MGAASGPGRHLPAPARQGRYACAQVQALVIKAYGHSVKVSGMSLISIRHIVAHVNGFGQGVKFPI